MVFAWKQRFAFKHLCEDAARTPYVHFNVILLPCEHNLWSTVISRRDIAGHLWVLNTSKAKIADLQIAVLIHQNIAWLKISVYDASGVHILETALYILSNDS